jgi:hypothetical protein
MTRSTLLDRLNHELEAFGKKAQAALDEGKLQIEQLRVRRRRDHIARDLGLMVHRRERSGESEPRRLDALLARLDELEAELARLDGQIVQARQQRPGSAAAGSTGVTSSSTQGSPGVTNPASAPAAAGSPGGAATSGSATAAHSAPSPGVEPASPSASTAPKPPEPPSGTTG